MKLRPSILLMVLLIVATGCATVLASGPSTVRIESEPAGARVTAQNGEVWGTTPVTRTEKPVGDRVLTFTLTGYDVAVLPLTRTIKPIAFLNLTNVLGWAVDFATGAMWKYDETYLRAQLAKKVGELPPASRHVYACHAYASIERVASDQHMPIAEVNARNAAVAAVTGSSVDSCTLGGLSTAK